MTRLLSAIALVTATAAPAIAQEAHVEIAVRRAADEAAFAAARPATIEAANDRMPGLIAWHPL